MILWKFEMDGHTQHPWSGFTMGPRSPSSSSAPATTSTSSSPPTRVTRTLASSSAMRVSLGREPDGRVQGPRLLQQRAPNSAPSPWPPQLGCAPGGHSPTLSICQSPQELRGEPLEAVKADDLPTARPLLPAGDGAPPGRALWGQSVGGSWGWNVVASPAHPHSPHHLLHQPLVPQPFHSW